MKIYIDRLHGGKVEKIEEILPPEFLEVKEEELIFKDKITIKGEAYLVEEHLYITLKAETKVQMPCQICNRLTEMPLVVESFTHAEGLSDTKTPFYDYSALLREAILLELPPFFECSGNKCPERSSVKHYLKNQDNSTHFPFADLN